MIDFSLTLYGQRKNVGYMNTHTFRRLYLRAIWILDLGSWILGLGL